MATIAPGLNFRIGADVKGINKAIREAERSLKGAVSTFSSIGNSLSLALSAPIAAFGALSIKAAGDMEAMRFALEGTMKDAGRSVNEARAELEELRKAALAPGLDFEQAVKGSVRLQSVGKSAEEAREIIVQLANALALSGGTADQLDGVTRQFTQMIGKGKIMQEDLTIILENMPALAKVMKDTFGTTNAEMLRKMGVNVDDFISKLTTGMQTLPRAQGGIANSIVNAQNAIKQAIADVGAEINKTFNVSGALNSFSEWVAGLAKWFRGLDEDTKRLIGSFVVFAAVIGPAFKVMQAGIFIVGKMQVAFLALQKALALSQTEGGITGLIGKWRALDTVMKASIIGAIAAVVLAAAAAFAVLNKDMSAAAQAARTVDSVSRSAQESIAAETTKTRELVGVIKSSEASYNDKKAALNELKKISPEYFGNLDLEKNKVTDIEMANNRYTDSLLRAATARAAMAQIEENARKRINLKETVDPSFWQTTMNALTSLGSSFNFAANQAQSMAKNWREQETALDASDNAMRELIKTNGGVVEASKATQVQTGKETGAVNDLADSYRELDKAAKLRTRKQETEDVKAFKADVSPQIEGPQMPDMVQSAEAFRGLPENISIATSAMQEYLSVAEKLGSINTSLQGGILSFGEAFKQTSSVISESGNLFAQVFFGIAEAVSAAAEQGAASFAELAKAAIVAAVKIVRAYIQQGVAAAVASALKLPFPFNLAAGTIAGAAAASLFTRLISSIGIPALAEGGVVNRPTAVMVGEYAGARANPEIIAPESKMRDVFSEVLRASGGMGGGKLVARVSGRDLLFVVEQAEVDAGRRRGK